MSSRTRNPLPVVTRLLSPLWRRWLRLRRLTKSAKRLGPPDYVKLVLFDLINPACHWLKSKPVVRFRIRGYAECFLVRMGTSDLECLLEVILEEEYSQALLLQKSAGLIIDAGANVGYAARYFLRAFPGSIIICIEPDEENMSLLRRNVSIVSGYSSAMFFQCFLSDNPGEMHIDRSRPAWAFRMSPGRSKSGESIPAKTVDQILEETGTIGRRVDLFKCDIEGAEAQLFRSPGPWLSRVSCLVVETHGPYWATSFIEDIRRFSRNFDFVQEDEMVFARRTLEHMQDSNE